ncbi:MAG TPA: hypothetical protein VN706_18215 [Gemmatimonadaceae bacterium]|nr:hypothetical protein [Gemmatimonadaceae bacterium]
MIKRSLRLLLLPCLLAAAPAAPRAADSPFVGDWKLNPSKSTLTDRMKVESAGGNKYTFNFGGGPETIVVDGTDQRTPLSGDGTLAVAVEGDKWKVIRKTNGRTTITANWSLSKDGKALTDHFTSFNADGSPFQLNYVYERRAGESGFAGTWVSTSLQAVNYVVVLQIRPYDEGGLAIVDSATQVTGNVQFPATLVRRLDEHTIELMRKASDGQVTPRIRLELSSDLKTMTLTPAIAGEDPHILVFDRQ